MPTPKTVYVTQYGVFWKLTPLQWRDLCAAAIKDDGYDLDKVALRLKDRPRAIRRDMDSDRDSYYTTRNDMPLFHPLDWDKEQFEDALRDIESDGWFKGFRILRRCPRCSRYSYHWYEPTKVQVNCCNCGHNFKTRLKADEKD